MSKHMPFNPVDDYNIKVQQAKVFLGFSPTADVVEVRHGTWTMRLYNEHCSCGKSRKVARYECSECKRIADMQPYGLTYCPNCSAKMDGEMKVE